MTDIAYEPPQREFADTLLAFKDFEMSSTWRVRIEPDPLGDVNQILTLMHGSRRIKSVLWPVPVGASVRLVRDEGAWSITNLESLRYQLWDGSTTNFPLPEVNIQPPGWRIEVDDIAVLMVADTEMCTPYVAPVVPLRTRIRQAVRKRARDLADQIAGELGYHRADECSGWDE